LRLFLLSRCRRSAICRIVRIVSRRRRKAILTSLPGAVASYRTWIAGVLRTPSSRVAANFVGWEQDHALFDRELEKVIRALRTGEGGREKPPPAKL
jgi:hypothetical protein